LKPVVTAEEMAAADRAAQQSVGLETLIARAGFAVARIAVAMMGGTYGRRVVVIAGKGHNGDDGRTAGELLSRRGARVTIYPVEGSPAELPACDLVIDAAFGTGFRGSYLAPRPPKDALVLAVDIPSGVAADTGSAGTDAVRADVTVTFAALKPGLVLGEGPDRSGAVVVEPIGIDVGEPRQHLVEDADLELVPLRERAGNKWNTALGVVAGSPGMLGAAAFAASGAIRAGAGMVRLGSPGAHPGSVAVLEAVAFAIPAVDWTDEALEQVERCRAVVIGPGLGRSKETQADVRAFLRRLPVPAVVDADGLFALGGVDEAVEVLGDRRPPTVLTPHEGEFTRLAGRPPDEDRVGSVRSLAAAIGATVLLKGATTVVAAPDGKTLLAAAGSPRLATAGTGDVLSGVIGAFVARGLDPWRAAAIGAHVHGRAGALGFSEGLEASDLPLLVASVLSEHEDAEDSA
jgi:ADP-dependent NAD(P)H-hydrate dehydratase / NAD(P)H-hydrate epimerase